MRLLFLLLWLRLLLLALGRTCSRRWSGPRVVLWRWVRAGNKLTWIHLPLSQLPLTSERCSGKDQGGLLLKSLPQDPCLALLGATDTTLSFHLSLSLAILTERLRPRPSSRLMAFYTVSEQNLLHTGPSLSRRELANAAAVLPEALLETEDKAGVAQRDRDQEGAVIAPNLPGRHSLFRSDQSLATDWRGQRQRPRVEAPRVMPQEESNSLMSSAALEYYIPVKAFYIARR